MTHIDHSCAENKPVVMAIRELGAASILWVEDDEHCEEALRKLPADDILNLVKPFTAVVPGDQSRMIRNRRNAA